MVCPCLYRRAGLPTMRIPPVGEALPARLRGPFKPFTILSAIGTFDRECMRLDTRPIWTAAYA